MTRLPAHKASEQLGWVLVPEDQHFSWFLRLQTTDKTSVTVPIKVLTKNRGWTQYFFADFDGLTSSQIEQLLANNVLSLSRQQQTA
ncbi:MAG: hypothetical protein ABW199_00540 [Caulobacterales bacterium]